ncbi:MAG: oligosaccharyl transferase, archaeosortase A system-associated [Chloroflexi bacterium]|nr:oligosaccharyl transferase, archaeosortase A system-associated [Chloroflexota bacterium]
MEHQSKNKVKLSTGAKYGLALFAIFGFALFLRIYFSYDNVFRDGWINFQETDCYYQMRQVLNLALHFPHRNLFDPYFIYPGGFTIGSPPFFYLILGFFSWLFGAGSPSLKVIETVGAYVPAIMGALVTVPVYFIGKELFNRKAGLLAAALIAILPGQFLWRTMLGFPDYHVAETLFTVVTMLFLILALKSARQNGISFRSVWVRDWKILKRPLIYTLSAGVALALYLLSWTGGGLFIFIIFVFALIQFVMDHLRGKSTEYLCVVSVFTFIIALLLILPAWNGYALWNLQFAALLIGILTFLVLGALSFFMAGRNMKGYYYPAVLAVLGGIGAALFYLVNPPLFNSILDKLSVFTPAPGMLTIAEVKGLSLSSAWQQFTTGFYLAFISLAILAYFVIKEGTSGKTLLFVWSLIMLVATFGQVRFAYYFAVNVAILSAFPLWKVLEFAGLKETAEGAGAQAYSEDKIDGKERQKLKVSKKSQRKKRKAEQRRQSTRPTGYLNAKNVYVSITVVVIFFLAFYPNIGTAVDRVKYNTGLNDEWHESLIWMRQNTPDPFQNPDLYYELQVRPPAGEAFQYPESAYGVMSWWDYGYSITYVAHRIPNANPSQIGAPDAALFFTAQDEASAKMVLDRLGSRYVIIDYPMAIQKLVGGKFYAMAIWAGSDSSEFFDDYYQRTHDGGYQQVMLYYPEYYRSMCVRLYSFGGEAWDPDAWVKSNSDNKIQAVSYVERTDPEGNKYREIANVKQFNTYATAKAFVDADPDYIIVGTSPYISPVPLEKLQHFELVHKSPATVFTQGNDTISYVEIFEYSP